MDIVQPVGWMTEAEDGTPMFWPTRTEAEHYCADGEHPSALYTQLTMNCRTCGRSIAAAPAHGTEAQERDRDREADRADLLQQIAELRAELRAELATIRAEDARQVRAMGSLQQAGSEGAAGR